MVEVAAIAMFDALPFLLAWPLGAMMRRLREYRVTLEERNRQLDQEREVNARRAVLLLPPMRSRPVRGPCATSLSDSCCGGVLGR